ncbi:MAG TPA: hypothetical protein VF742_00280, partial [Terracidiphilus sp.]
MAVACLVISAALPAAAQQNQQPAPDDATPVLHINTREAVLDVVVRDKDRSAVTDLKAEDFEVFDVPKHGDKVPRHILSVRVIDPHRDTSRVDGDNGFRVSSGAVCALGATAHYQIAIQAGQEPGYHQVQVKTSRPNLMLSFRKHYFVGLMPGQAKPADRKAATEDIALGQAACWHSTFPPTLTLAARGMVTPDAKATRYVVLVKPESLADIGLDGSNT